MSQPNGDDLRLMYEQLTQLVLNEDRLSSERTNIFLLSNSFLIAGFVLSLSLPDGIGKPMAFAMASFGILLSGFQVCMMYFNFATLAIWHKVLDNLEQGNSFPNLSDREFLPQETRHARQNKNRFIVLMRADSGGIFKKCVNSQAVYPLSEQHGLEAQERR